MKSSIAILFIIGCVAYASGDAAVNPDPQTKTDAVPPTDAAVNPDPQTKTDAVPPTDAAVNTASPTKTDAAVNPDPKTKTDAVPSTDAAVNAVPQTKTDADAAVNAVPRTNAPVNAVPPTNDDADAAKNRCICPRVEPVCIKKECGPHEVFKCGGSACQETCATRNKPCTIETFAPVNACYCEEGYVRDKHDKCIPIAECPKK